MSQRQRQRRSPLSTRPVTLRGVVTLLLLAAAALVGLAGPAAAHDELVGSTPKAGATVTAPPAQVTLQFAEPPGSPELTAVVVVGPDGSRVEDGKPTVAGSTVTQPLRPLSEPGRYEIEFRIVADDGHPVTGKVPFTLAEPATSAAMPATTAPPSAGPSPAPSSSATAATSPSDSTPASGSSSWPWVVGGLLVVALGAVGYAVRARSRSGRGHGLGRSDPGGPDGGTP